MAKKVLVVVKLQVPAGKATPAPPVGPALGQHAINLMQFCKEYNARTADKVGQVIPEVVAYEENGKDAKSVDYARLVAVLIEAVKEQQREIEAQRTRIEALERATGRDRFSAKAGE